MLGAGAISPIAELEITVEPFDIRESWTRVYGMDVDWNRTAVVWGAKDPCSGVVYLYSEHYQGQGEPASHADAIQSRGGVDSGCHQPGLSWVLADHGKSLMELYRRYGLHLQPAVNSVEAGISEVWQMLVGGQLKVMSHLTNWLREFRRYHRDDKGTGKIVQRDDHIMDVTRYLVVSGGS